MRFQGQWADEESDLYYNRHRYYDVFAGQYLSPDPIGLQGGERPQGYVANSNVLIDAFGLGATLSNLEARRWHIERVKNIDISGARTRENAEIVVNARNALKRQARALMKDRAEAQKLDKTDPIKPFQYYADKYYGQLFSGEDL